MVGYKTPKLTSGVLFYYSSYPFAFIKIFKRGNREDAFKKETRVGLMITRKGDTSQVISKIEIIFFISSPSPTFVSVIDWYTKCWHNMTSLFSSRSKSRIFNLFKENRYRKIENSRLIFYESITERFFFPLSFSCGWVKKVGFLARVWDSVQKRYRRRYYLT